MGKASRRKRESSPTVESQPDPPPWSGTLLIASAAAGIVLAALSTYVHYELTSSGGGYTSFCNVNATINCDAVVTSRFGQLLGIPVSAWAVAFYGVLFAIALRAMRGAPAVRDRARADAFAWATAGALFSLYLAVVSLLVLKTVCLLCAGLYLVSGLGLFAAWKLASPAAKSCELLRERWRAVRRRPALSLSAAAAVAAIVFLPGWLGAPTRMTRQDVFHANPKFYEWYTGQPIIADLPRDGGVAVGPDTAPIILVEFSDFECPHCGRAHVTLKDVLPRFSGEVRFVFHHFPLSHDCNDAISGRVHEHACAAAIAAECAAEQGRFAPFANLLFANQDALGSDALKRYAEQAGLDLAALEHCRGATAAAERVRADVDAGKRAGVHSTPTFFINGRKIEGTLSFENWLMAFAVELDKG